MALSNLGRNIFIGDPAATSHMTSNKLGMYNIVPINASVMIGNGQSISCTHKRKLDVICKHKDESISRSLLSSGGLMADVPCLDYSLDDCKGYPDDVQTTKHTRRTQAWSRCALTSLGAHVSPFGASSAGF